MRTDIYEILDTICDSPSKKVLATIIDVKGSAYKKAGSTMLILESEKQVGILSGGCLEQDLFARVNDFLYEPSTSVFTYDLSSEDDLSWGQGSGCNGVIKVVVETITSKYREDYIKVKELVNEGKTVMHLKRISMDLKVIDYLFRTEEGVCFGQWHQDLPDIDQIPEDSLTKLDNQKVYVFKQKIMARPKLYIYGAGMDAKPLADLAFHTGFQVIISDWRPAFCSKKHFPFAYKILHASPDEFVQSTLFLPSDSIVLMTHNYEKDEQLLQLLLKKNLGYLGILGSKARAQKLLSGVFIPNWVHYPVGLKIGAEGPQEIAVSIIAELIQIKARRLTLAV